MAQPPVQQFITDFRCLANCFCGAPYARWGIFNVQVKFIPNVLTLMLQTHCLSRPRERGNTRRDHTPSTDTYQ